MKFPETPRPDKQDLTVVKQYPPASTSTAKR